MLGEMQLYLSFCFKWFIIKYVNLQSTTGKKRKRKDEVEVEKPKDVIHVRAKRGQATDSHSLAERVSFESTKCIIIIFCRNI